MSFGGLSNILDTINSATGNRPRQPWDEQPEGASKPPIVIQPQNLAPPSEFNRPRPSVDQLDASNLAGPVPTDLSGGGQQPFDYTKILNRGVTDSGQPDMDTSPVFDYNKALNPSAVTVDSFGVPRNLPDTQRPNGYASLPSEVQTPINRTWNGTLAPNITDEKYTSMGRGASASAAFKQGLAHGGLIGGGINALIGVLDKGYGRQAQYNTDAQRWFNTKDAQLKAEEADPLIRSRIQEAQFEQELPGRIQQQQAYQESIGNRTIAVNQDKAISTADQHEADNKARLERQNAKYDSLSSQKLDERFKDLKAESLEPGNINHGLNDEQLYGKAAEGIRQQQEAVLAKTKAQTAHYEELTKSTGQRITQADQRLKIMQQNANTNAGRLAQGQSNAARIANNQATNNQLKSLQSYVGSLKTQYTAHSKTLNDPYASPDAKAAAEKEMGRINTELNDVDAQSRGLTGAPARGQKPNAGNPGGHKVGDTVKTPDGKRIKIKAIENGQVTDWDEVP